ncbi:TetR/AcrR family transcriptional regulator [Mycolicibacterium arenosum]|uniref:TetR/AcrR family transcriptional regulator n=1 Tax=Mycolicibacterium arenosum TaxID=2952157 RepID=A0ABT1M5P6_9MYCO|nr:TetR/AcrR family transcriptional regulator [Mycolicibacterium sp. CAU 1645]MCP9274478.1 TetR/AcrR family transcriptional regulator [Mycolicibacterium sp. CAU 1645]
MTEAADSGPAATRLHIIHAAAHEFALKPYTRVNLDDVLLGADVTKGALYTHFRSKHELAMAVIEERTKLTRQQVADLTTPSSSALETLVDVTYLIAVSDCGEEMARAGLNLLESVGRFDGLQAKVVDVWVGGFAELVRQAQEQEDVLPAVDPEAVARTIVSMYLGLRQTSDLDEPKTLIGDLEATLLLILPGFAEPGRLDYLHGFIQRRSALAIRNTAPLVHGNL